MLQVTPNCIKASPCEKMINALCVDKPAAGTSISSMPTAVDAVSKAVPLQLSSTLLGSERQLLPVIRSKHFFSADTSRPVDSPEPFKASLFMKLLVTLLVVVHTAAKIPGFTGTPGESRFVLGHESVDFLYMGLAHNSKNTISHT